MKPLPWKSKKPTRRERLSAVLGWSGWPVVIGVALGVVVLGMVVLWGWRDTVGVQLKWR